MKQIYAIGIIAVGILMTACRTPKNVTYLQDLKDGETVKVLNYKGITLRPQDAVSIVVNTKTTELTNLLNLPLSTQVIGAPQTAALAQSHGTSGYTLDSEGNVDFPLVGKIHLAGLTREEAAARVKQTLEEKQVAANPVVTVEFLNLKFSVLGEVGHAGEFGINRDKTTLIEALGMAGDMNLYGKRDSVFVYRQEGDHQFARLLYPAGRRGVCAAQQLPQAPVVGQCHRGDHRLVLAVGPVGADDPRRACIQVRYVVPEQQDTRVERSLHG